MEVATNDVVGMMVPPRLKVVDAYIERDEVLSGNRDNLQNAADSYSVSKSASFTSKLTDRGVNDVSDDGSGQDDVSDNESGRRERSG